jgi:oligopeptide/dipeptide ABC transporter ATP-binding protein
VEIAPVHAIFARPAHPYTEGLFRAIPRIDRSEQTLSAIAGQVPSIDRMPGGCRFAARCPLREPACEASSPRLEDVAPGHAVRCHVRGPARRMGAVVTATDVRPATKEQVESLGAKFLAVEDDEFKQAQTAGGYAKEMSQEYQAKQAALTASHIAKQDIVITTALIPGRPAPKLISAEMVASMRPGSVIVDLAVERGGNCALSKPGETVITDNGVKIVGHLNMPGRLAATASALYAKNLFAFVETLVDKEKKALAINWDDELVRATLLTRDGAVVHPNFQPK